MELTTDEKRNVAIERTEGIIKNLEFHYSIRLLAEVVLYLLKR